MDAAVFRSRVAPLLHPDTLRILRLVSRDWQWVVDQLLPVKGAFGLRGFADELTCAVVRYAHLHTTAHPFSALQVCAGGELEDLQWGLAMFPQEVQLSYCKSGMLSRVARTDGAADPGVRGITREALRRSCESGHLAVAQWLVATFGLTASDVRTDVNFALRGSCENGHLAVAQWLTSTLGLTASDVRRNSNRVLRTVCSNGHLAVAKWLVDTFGLTAADARSKHNGALRLSCSRGHLAVAQWLVATFHLTVDDARATNNYAIRWSRRHAHEDVTAWLASTFDFTDEEANARRRCPSCSFTPSSASSADEWAAED
jgi:hypothetical protein